MGDEGGLPLQFRILGPLEVVRGDTCLAFRGSRERAVLALLVLHANRTVSAERLAEDLWSGDPPEGAIHSLRVYVSRLRQALGAAGQAVVTRPSAYELQVDPATVDALRFEELVARGRDEAKAGNQSGAAAALREALALWRGPALADVSDAPFARAQASRLEEARLCALEDRIDADLACGRHGEVTAELEALTGEHPFRERLWSQRMVALYRSGRQAEALRVYQELRSTLQEQLGLEPSSAVQQVEGAVLRHDPELDWRPKGRAGPGAGGGVEPTAAAETVPSVATMEPGRLPQPLRREERLPLVGRESELSRLDKVWQATCSGQRHLVLLAGEPGIGKSLLAAEFARTAHGGGALVLFGRCDEGMGVPYQPFVEALGRYLRQADLVLGRLAGELVRLVPEVGERVGGLAPPVRSDPETERYRLFDAVAAWLGAVSETAPVLFVVEDLHWATKPTLLLLAHLLRSDEDLGLLLMATFRDTPLDMTPDLADLVAEVLRLPGVERLRLTGLNEPGVGALMEAQAGHDLDDEGWALAKVVHGETAGNPFYVREMLSLLAEKGDIIRRDGRWVPGQPLAQLDVPDSVRDVVERRLTRLPDRTSEMLALAAVLGERFDLAVLAEAGGDSETSVVETLGPAVGARLVNETNAGSYHFTHALVRSALEDSLGPTRRAQLHRAAGSAIEAVHADHLGAHLSQLAHHFARARDDERAIDYASRAGDRALTQLAHDEAAAYYRQALELLDAAGRPDASAQRCELLIALGEAQRQAGDAAHRQTLFDAARLAQQLGDPDALARAALANYRGVFSSSGFVDAERVALLEAALDTAALNTPLRARLLATLAAELQWSSPDDNVRRRALSDEALTIARRSADPATLAQVLQARCPAIWEPSTARERLSNTEDLLSVAERVGDPAITTWAWCWRLVAATELADLAESDRSLDHLTTLAADLRQPMLLWCASYCRAARLLLAGRLGEAEHAVMEARELGIRAGQPDAHLFFGIQRYQLRFEQGRLGELVDRYRQIVDESGGSPTTRAFLALAYCELDRIGDARHVFAPLAAQVDDLPVNVSWLEVTSVSAVVCATLGDQPLAARLHDRLEPYSDQFVGYGVLWWASVSHYLGLLAATLQRYDEAEARFIAAQSLHEQLAAPTWLARTRLEWARMLLRRHQAGDADRARHLLGQAVDAARNLGLGNVERQAVGLLQQ